MRRPAVALLALVAVARVAFADEHHIALDADARAASACAAGILRAEPLCSGDACADGLTTRAHRWKLADGTVPLALPTQTAWRITVDAGAACWSAATIVPAGRTESRTPIRLHAAGTIGGRVRVPRGSSAPSTFRARVQSTDALAIPPTDVSCEVANARWSCIVPAGAIDLRLEPDGFVPHYLWDVVVSAGARTDLGELALGRGTSLSGWVAVDGDGATLDGVRVTIAPALPPAMGAGWTIEERRRKLRVEVVTPSPKGFFQLRHVAAGTYDVIAAKDGWSTARLLDLRVEEGKETRVADALRLVPLARLEIAITPPLDPDGKAWTVELSAPVAKSTLVTNAARGIASETGAWTSDPLERGLYDLLIRDTRKIVHVRQSVEVDHAMPPLGITVKTFPIRGRVTLGGEPLQCELMFSNSFGKSVHARTGKNGEIVAILQEEGKWRVEVRPPGAGRIIREIEVRRRPDDTHATVEIELPAGRVEGFVVDRAGNPVKATVRFRGDERRSGEYSTTDDGKFTFVGLEPDQEIQLFAKGRKQSSAVRAHRVSGEKHGEPVTLVMRETVRVTGRVRSANGQPVAGAVVRWITTGGFVSEEATGTRGEFAFDADGNHATVDVVVLPPMPPVKTISVPLARATEPIEIVVGGPAGHLDLLYTGDGGDLDVRRWPFVRSAGAFMPVHTFRYPPNRGAVPRDRIRGGVRVEIEPGTYTLCATPVPSADCITRVVAAGAHEVIDARPLTR